MFPVVDLESRIYEIEKPWSARARAGLLVLMFSATSVNFFAINVVPRFMAQPFLGGEWKSRERKFGKNTLIGAIIFGIGWGLSGQCPGSAISSIGIGNLPVLVGIAGMFAGAYVMGRWFS